MRPDRLTLVVAQRIRRARERVHAQIDANAQAIHRELELMAETALFEAWGARTLGDLSEGVDIDDAHRAMVLAGAR